MSSRESKYKPRPINLKWANYYVPVKTYLAMIENMGFVVVSQLMKRYCDLIDELPKDKIIETKNPIRLDKYDFNNTNSYAGLASRGDLNKGEPI